MASKLCPFCMRMTDSEICPHCGQNIDYPGVPTHLPAGYVVDGKHPYVIGAALGQGGFGITYIALDMVTGERVAIKEYFPTFCCSRTGGTISAYPKQDDIFLKGRARFLDEARLLKSLSDLKSIVNVLDFFEFNNSAYLVMEYLDGPCLKEYTTMNGKSSAQTFLKQVQPLMEDIDRMHKRGVVHRDIAPDNIILLPDGQMKLIDFGAARSYVGDKSMTVVVKKGFAPVEQYLTKGVTACSDVYSLAATIYFCITGVIPMDSADRQYDNIALESPSSMGVNITPEQEQALNNALAIMPKDRTQSMAEFLNQLTAVKQPQETHSSVSKSAIEPQPRKNKKTITVLVAIAAALALFAGIFMFIKSNDAAQMNNPTAPSKTTNPTTEIVPDKETTAPTEDPTVALKYTLMEDSDQDQYVLGSKYQRQYIHSITFLSSTNDAGRNSWDVSYNQDGTVLAWVKTINKKNNLYIAAEGGVKAPKNCSNLFASYEHLKKIDFNDNLDTSRVTNMSNMFKDCKTITALDVTGFDTANVEDMSFMFKGCSVLTELDVAGFDTSNVKNMGSMFSSCSDLTTLDVTNFDTAKVTDISSMFADCKKLTRLDISNFKTSNMTNISNLFLNCSVLTEMDLSHFNTAKVTDMSGLFEGCARMTKADISGFNTANVTDMSAMFRGCRKLTVADVSGFNTAKVTSMRYMFLDCTNLTKLDVSGFNTSNVTDMRLMFRNISNMVNLDVTGFDVSKVTDYTDFMDYNATINGRPWKEFFTK